MYMNSKGVGWLIIEVRSLPIYLFASDLDCFMVVAQNDMPSHYDYLAPFPPHRFHTHRNNIAAL
jgi:hypothetical protein